MTNCRLKVSVRNKKYIWLLIIFLMMAIADMAQAGIGVQGWNEDLDYESTGGPVNLVSIIVAVIFMWLAVITEGGIFILLIFAVAPVVLLVALFNGNEISSKWYIFFVPWIFVLLHKLRKINTRPLNAEGIRKNISTNNIDVRAANEKNQLEVLIPDEGEIYCKESDTCLIFTIPQWQGGPFWARAFSAEDVKQSSISVGLLSYSHNMCAADLAQYISHTHGATIKVLDSLVDRDVDPICSITHSDSSSARYKATVEAREKGWLKRLIVD